MWTPDELKSNACQYSGHVWRMVETQYVISTLRLVDNLEEQQVLESLLDESKPPIPHDCQHLDFLLYTPFRYAPLGGGSRFRRANQPEGVFYASESEETLICENAFLLLLFYAESPGTKRPKSSVQRTAFSVQCKSNDCIDLTTPPLLRDKLLWTDLANYSHCQDLADAARRASITAIRYQSVRDPNGGCNIGLLSCSAFAATKTSDLQTWHILVKPKLLQLWCESTRTRYEFKISDFMADPRLESLVAAI
jgi:hypothetical protein